MKKFKMKWVPLFFLTVFLSSCGSTYEDNIAGGRISQERRLFLLDKGIIEEDEEVKLYQGGSIDEEIYGNFFTNKKVVHFSFNSKEVSKSNVQTIQLDQVDTVEVHDKTDDWVNKSQVVVVSYKDKLFLFIGGNKKTLNEFVVKLRAQIKNAKNVKG